MHELGISPLAPSDLEDYVRLRNNANPWARPESAEEVARRDGSTPQRRFVGRVDGELVAVGACGPGPYTHRGDVMLNVAVAPEHQRRGYGGALLEHMLSDLPEGTKTLGAWVPEPSTGAIRLAKRHGFRELTRSQEAILDLTDFDPARFAEAHQATQGMGLTLKTLADVDTPALRHQLFDAWREMVGRTKVSAFVDSGDFETWQHRTLDTPGADSRFATIALHGDEVAGISNCWFEPGGIAYTYLTAAAAPWRTPDDVVEVSMKARTAGLLKDAGYAALRTTFTYRRGMSVNDRMGYVRGLVRIRVTRDASDLVAD